MAENLRQQYADVLKRAAYLGVRAVQAEAEVARLRAGESPEPPDEHVTPTPAEMIRLWNDATPERRLAWAAAILDNSARASACFQMDHDGRLEYAEAERSRLQQVSLRVRQLHQPVTLTGIDQQWCAACSTSYGNHRQWLPWPCPTIQALDGEAPSEPTPTIVFDCQDRPAWDRIMADKGRHAELVAWMRSQGLTPEHIYRLEIYLGGPSARVFEYERDELGRKYLQGNDIARREPYNVILTSLPPAPGEEATA